MLDWWLKHGPPVYVAAAAYLGLIKEEGSSASKDPGDLEGLEKLFGPSGILN